MLRSKMSNYGDPDQLARRATTSEAMEDLPLLSQKLNKIEEGVPDVVSLQNMHQLVQYTRLAEFRSR